MRWPFLYDPENYYPKTLFSHGKAPRVKQLLQYLVILFLITGTGIKAQDPGLDSLKRVLEILDQDTSKVNTLNDIAYILYRISPDEAIDYAREAKQLAEKLSNNTGLAQAYKTLGLGFYMQGSYAEAIRQWELALKIYEQNGNDLLAANILSNLGSAYYTIGNNVEAIEYSIRALKIAEELGDSTRIGTLLNTIGLVYSEQPATLDKARSYYLRTKEIAEAIGYVDLVGVSFINLGELYMEKEMYDSALFFFQESLAVLSSNIDISTSLTFIGNIYSQREDYARAIQYYQDGYELAEMEDAQREMVSSLLGMASVYENQKMPDRAIGYFKQAESIAEEIGLNNELSGIYEGLASNYADISDFDNAYRYLSLQNSIDNTIYRMDSEKRANNLIFSYQMEKKQDEIAILEQQSEIDSLKSRRQRAIIISTGLFGLLLLAMAIGLNQRMKFIRETNKKINAQNELITDSISYAQRIQSAILPSPALMDELMPEHFVILRPKDIVSGDFYWVKEVQDHLVIVGADCTGHGVPGAFMSMLGITMLNSLIGDRCFNAPSAILEQLRLKVKDMMVQQGGSEEQKDGMDMALAILNKSTNELHYAGANNPLYVIRNRSVEVNSELEAYASTETESHRLFELKADKQPVGVHWEEHSFTTHSVFLKAQDTFYIFSDGFVDQFGGPNRKKYKSLNFKKLLLSLQNEPMKKQGEAIESAFISWKGQHEQIDDVSVIGVRV